jgi:hypothetical protein
MPNVSSEVYARIATVVARYGDYCDQGRWAEAADLFTEDGVFDAEHVFGQVVRGRPALTEFMATRPAAIAHHPTSFYVDKVVGDEHFVRMKMLVVFDGAISSIDYKWVVVPVGEDLKIKRQEIAMVGRLKTRPSQPAVG